MSVYYWSIVCNRYSDVVYVGLRTAGIETCAHCVIARVGTQKQITLHTHTLIEYVKFLTSLFQICCFIQRNDKQWHHTTETDQHRSNCRKHKGIVFNISGYNGQHPVRNEFCGNVLVRHDEILQCRIILTDHVTALASERNTNFYVTAYIKH